MMKRRLLLLHRHTDARALLTLNDSYQLHAPHNGLWRWNPRDTHLQSNRARSFRAVNICEFSAHSHSTWNDWSDKKRERNVFCKRTENVPLIFRYATWNFSKSKATKAEHTNSTFFLFSLRIEWIIRNRLQCIEFISSHTNTFNGSPTSGNVLHIYEQTRRYTRKRKHEDEHFKRIFQSIFIPLPCVPTLCVATISQYCFSLLFGAISLHWQSERRGHVITSEWSRVVVGQQW